MILNYKWFNAAAFVFAAAVGNAGIITIPEGAEPSTVLARDEFTNYVKRITGRTDACPDTVIGTVKTLNSRMPKAAVKALEKTDDIEAAWTGFDGKTLWIIGKNEVAELYATYRFFETQLGVRWFQAKTKDDPGDWVPSMEKIVLKPFADFREPAFKIRRLDACRSYGNVPATNAAICAMRNGFQINAPYATRIPYEKPETDNCRFYTPRVPHKLVDLGGDHCTFIHTFPEKTFDENPEVFALQGGKRRKGKQYCISNKKLRDATAERIIKAFDRDGGDGQFIFGMWDETYNWCECAECVAQDDPAEQEPGRPNVSRRFALAVNYISAKVWEKYPNADLRVWAYHTYRLRAKDVPFDPRLKVCFCDHGRCYGHKIDDPRCARNAWILSMLRDWVSAVPYVYVYAYLFCTETFYSCNEYGMADDIRKYAKMGVKGWKEEAVFSDSKFVHPFGGGGHRIDSFPSVWQTLYVTGHMLWDPTLDENKLIAEAEEKYYGAAYPAMKKYHDFRRRLWAGNSACMGYPKGDERREQLLDMPGSKERLLSLLDQAEKLASGDSVRLFRIGRDRRWLKLYWIEPNEERKAKAGKSAFCAPLSDTPVLADGRISEAVWTKSVYSEFSDRTVGAAYDSKSISFYSTSKGAGNVFCVYPPNIDNRRYRFEVADSGCVTCEVSPGGREPGAFGARASVRKTSFGEVCEISIPVEKIHPLRAGDVWQVMFGPKGGCADWMAGNSYSPMAIGAPYEINGSFANLDAKGKVKGWVLADEGGEIIKEGVGNAMLLKGRMFATMAHGELRQSPVARRIRFSFRAKGEGAVRVAFYRYTDVADTNNADRFKKHTYKRIAHKPNGEGGTFALSSEMATYSGEYVIAPGEWCAIAFYREKSKKPAVVADVSIVRLDD